MEALIVIFALLILVILFPNAADRVRERGGSGTGFAAMGYILLLAVYGIMALGGLMVIGYSVISQDPALMKTFSDALPPDLPLSMESPLTLGIGLVISALWGVLTLLRPVRQLFARLIPLNPESSTHAVALSLISLIVVQMVSTLGVGLKTLTDMNVQAGEAAQMTIGLLWTQQLLTALFACIGVGFLIRRTPRQTLERLGLVIPTLSQVLIGIGLAFLLVILGIIVDVVLQQLGVPADENVAKLSEQLLGSLFQSPLGILTAGLSAAIGEETLMRGAVQPRFGLVLTSLLFALLHAQYGLSIVNLVVLAVGFVLGIVRNRYNTTTSMVVHAVYNMSLATLAYLGVNMP